MPLNKEGKQSYWRKSVDVCPQVCMSQNENCPQGEVSAQTRICYACLKNGAQMQSARMVNLRDHCSVVHADQHVVDLQMWEELFQC